MTHEVRSPTGRPASHRLLPIAVIAMGVVAVLAHLAGGAVLVHSGLGAILAQIGLAGDALMVGLAALVTIKLLLVFGARRWIRHR